MRANGVKRRPSKKVIFYPQLSKMRKILTIKSLSISFKVFQISIFQLIFTDIWLLKNLYTGKTRVPLFSKTLSLDITRP